MKLIHISDLHLGKRLGEYSLHEEQADILRKILSAVDAEMPDCVIIAGDVYNRPVPPEESVQLFDEFLSGLSARRIQTFVISGNHDSAERIAFGGRIMSYSGIHMSPVYDGKTEPVTLTDEYGEVCIYMLPFIKPINVRRCFPEAEIESYNDALKTAVSAMNIDTSKRNIIVTHQYITGASLSDSEELFIGGTENVDSEVFEDFDYAALGHIHGPQSIRPNMRYCGTPLKYSLSEAKQKKSVTVAELREKGDLTVRILPLTPLRDVKEYRGTFDEITSKDFCDSICTDDYVYITLTDEEEVPETRRRLRQIYPRLVKHSYDNTRTQSDSAVMENHRTADLSPKELFAQFYREYDPNGMTAPQEEYISRIIKEIWEGDLQ